MADTDDTGPSAADKGEQPDAECFELNPELPKLLRQAAERQGVSVETFAAEALHKAATDALDDERAKRERNARRQAALAGFHLGERERGRLDELETLDQHHRAIRRQAREFSG